MMMDIEQDSVLDIKEHDFQIAKDSLKEFTDSAKKELDLTKVSTSTGIFGLFNHKVTGSELNQLTSKIQEHLIHLNKLNHSLVEEFVQIYNAFESLDKDYIAGIVTAIKAAEEVSKREQEDRRNIKEMIQHQDGAVKVLKKFKEDIDKLKHLTDVDTAWEMLEEQTQKMSDFDRQVSEKFEQWTQEQTASQARIVKQQEAKWSEKEQAFAKEKEIITEEISTLSQRVEDLDTMWNHINALNEELCSLKQAFGVQNQKIAGLDGNLKQTMDAQKQFIDNANLLLSESREDFQKRNLAFEEEQTQKMSDFDRQVSEKFEQWTQEQTASQARIAKQQEAKWSEKEQAFAKEKEIITEEISTLSQRIRMLQIVAGGAVAVSIVQLLLILTGVI